MSSTCLLDEKDAKRLIPALCRKFYKLGWVSGTGGGVSIKQDSFYYVAPSGVQKELIRSADVFVLNEKQTIVHSPLDLKLSECTPLFMTAFQLRNAGAVLHSHHISTSILTQLIQGNEFRISHQEMIKGIAKGNFNDKHRYDDELVVPIIENTAFECDLTDSLQKAIKEYPNSNAVLVRRHGVYIWGRDWIQTKTMAECYHYLFDTAIKLKQFDLPLTIVKQ